MERVHIYIPFVLVVLNLLKEIGEHETTLHMEYNKKKEKKKCICTLCCTVKTRSGVKQIEVMNINSQKPIAFVVFVLYVWSAQREFV